MTKGCDTMAVMEDMTMARKTYTSTDVKRRYNEKVYKQINTQLPIDLADKFKEKCEAMGVPQRQVLLEMITAFIEEN